MCGFHSYSESSLEKLAKQGDYGDLKLLPGLPIFNSHLLSGDFCGWGIVIVASTSASSVVHIASSLTL